jgi:glycerol-3-phosphate dehydrogenase
MQRWNGWGADGIDYPVPPAGLTYLQERLGPGRPQPDADLAAVLKQVPPSSVPEGTLATTDAETRLRHAPGAASASRDLPACGPATLRSRRHAHQRSCAARRVAGPAGRHGAQAEALMRAAADGELDLVADTPTLWGEVRWGARSEWVIHLGDLMLRRTRLGLLLSDGGSQLLESIGTIIRPELDWTREHWQREVDHYRELWRASYAPPSRLIHPV